MAEIVEKGQAMSQNIILFSLTLFVLVGIVFLVVRGQHPAVTLNMNAVPAAVSDQTALLASPVSTESSEAAPLEESHVHVELKHVLEAIYDAAMKAQSNVQISNLHNFLWMFPADDNGIHTSRTIPLKLNDDKIVNVPVFTLLQHKNLCINEVKVKTTLDMDILTKPQVIQEIRDIKDKRYNVKVESRCADQSNTTVEIHLKAEEPTEMYNRFLDNYQKAI